MMIRKEVFVYLQSGAHQSDASSYLVSEHETKSLAWLRVPGKHYVQFEMPDNQMLVKEGIKYLREVEAQERKKFEDSKQRVHNLINDLLALPQD